MAKKTATLMRTLLMLQTSETHPEHQRHVPTRYVQFHVGNENSQVQNKFLMCNNDRVSEAMFKIYAVHVRTILNCFFLFRLLAQHLSKLPMPEDYALMEIKDLTRSYMLEVTQ